MSCTIFLGNVRKFCQTIVNFDIMSIHSERFSRTAFLRWIDFESNVVNEEYPLPSSLLHYHSSTLHPSTNVLLSFINSAPHPSATSSFVHISCLFFSITFIWLLDFLYLSDLLLLSYFFKFILLCFCSSYNPSFPFSPHFLTHLSLFYCCVLLLPLSVLPFIPFVCQLWFFLWFVLFSTLFYCILSLYLFASFSRCLFIYFSLYCCAFIMFLLIYFSFVVINLFPVFTFCLPFSPRFASKGFCWFVFFCFSSTFRLFPFFSVVFCFAILFYCGFQHL